MATLQLHSPTPPSATSPTFSEVETAPDTPPVETTTPKTTPPRQLRKRRSHPKAEKKRRVEGVWIMPTTSKRGQGACRKETQRRVGEMLGLFETLTVPTDEVLQPDEVAELVLALQHDHLLLFHPITKEECLRIAADEGGSKSCTCMLHTMDPPCSPLLQGIMANVSELGGAQYSGNLTNIGIEILKYILHDKAGFRNLQIQPEAKSTITATSAGSKVVYTMEDKNGTLTVEATPDFYVQKFAPIVYIIIGETESSGSKDPEVQLAVGTLGAMMRLRRSKMGAVLFFKNLTATMFIGECKWEGNRGKVKFTRIQRSSAYNLTDPDDLSTFAMVLVALSQCITSTHSSSA